MEQLFITSLHIDKVRHLHDTTIPVSEDGKLRHIILTGKNGSGKTSLLDAIAGYLGSACGELGPAWYRGAFEQARQNLENFKAAGAEEASIRAQEAQVKKFRNGYELARHGLALTFNCDEDVIYHEYVRGSCVFAYFKAQRRFAAQVPQHIEKVAFADTYAIDATPSDLFIKYLLDLKMTQALAATGGKRDKAGEIQAWFDRLRDILRDVYEDDALTIEFDEETYAFAINSSGREPFGFNDASDGFSSLVDIIVSLILRMVRGERRPTTFDMPGIVLVDEIENHLHLSLQRKVLPYLSSLFPNIQFIVSTHSPFVLSSSPNAVIYDLERALFVPDGMAGNTYDSIVEGYFGVDRLSEELRRKYARYQELTTEDSPSQDELVEIAELELYLDEIPDYLALDITTEYKKRKAAWQRRGAAQ